LLCENTSSGTFEDSWPQRRRADSWWPFKEVESSERAFLIASVVHKFKSNLLAGSNSSVAT